MVLLGRLVPVALSSLRIYGNTSVCIRWKIKSGRDDDILVYYGRRVHLQSISRNQVFGVKEGYLTVLTTPARFPQTRGSLYSHNGSQNSGLF